LEGTGDEVSRVVGREMVAAWKAISATESTEGHGRRRRRGRVSPVAGGGAVRAGKAGFYRE